jgi:hypothetical protein
MPIAAVPRYIPDKLLDQASLALRFGMYLRLWDVNQRGEWQVRGENKSPALRQAAVLTATDKRIIRELEHRQHAVAALIETGALMRVEAVAVAPFTTGLGNEHPLENGFAFLSPYGLPYLPGSGVKGVVRQAARELASGEWGQKPGWTDPNEYPFTIGKDSIKLPDISPSNECCLIQLPSFCFRGRRTTEQRQRCLPARSPLSSDWLILPAQMAPFFVQSRFYPDAGQLNQLLPCIGFISRFCQPETFTRIRVVFLCFAPCHDHKPYPVERNLSSLYDTRIDGV